MCYNKSGDFVDYTIIGFYPIVYKRKMKSHVVSLTVLLLFFARPLFSFDLTDGIDTLSGLFGDAYIDQNEGTTIFRSLNIPVGGRTESLATAYTGLADDISFFDYNPAASAILDNTEIAVFHNAWIGDSAMETVAGTRRKGNMGMGAQLKCFYVPFSEYNLYGERVASSYYSETSVTANIAYNFFAGYYFKGLAVGANVRGSWRNMPDYTDNQTDEIISGSGLEQSALAFMADVGIMLRFNLAKPFASREPNLRIGLALNNAGFALTGFGNGVQLDDALPTRLAAGISYRIAPPLLFTAEFRKPLNMQDFSASGTWSAGGGIEAQITRFFAVSGGFLLQGASPRISLGSSFDLKGVQLSVCYTFDATSSANPVNHISLGAKLRLGDQGRAERQKQIDALYTEGLEYYSIGNLEKAITLWEQALTLDKRFDPAIDGIKAAKKSLELYQHIADIQSLD